MSNEKTGQKAADDFRLEFDLGVKPVVSMARLIEQAMGIGVAYVDADAPGHGMTMRLGDRHMMSVGCTEHPMRLRSTLAHELGHLRLSSVDRYLGHGEWDERTPDEIQADSFARHLLVPLDAVRAAARKIVATTALLSDLVQRYMASPNIVAIQLRDVQAIDQDTFREWSKLSSGRLATQFGWHAEYEALVAQTKKPRAPQALLARAIDGYRWNLVTPATIARLDGQRDPRMVVEQLKAEGIVPVGADEGAAERPKGVGEGLTPEEVALLMSGTD